LNCGERGPTINRAVLLAKRVGRFLLSSLFAYFFDNEKSKKKERKTMLPMVGVFTNQVNTKYIVGTAMLKHKQWHK
jgi:hypothetical protein